MKMFWKMLSISNIILNYVIVVCFILGFLGCWRTIDENEIVAKVGNMQLTKDVMKQRMSSEGFRPDQKNEFIERWIDRELLYQEAKRLGLGDTEDVRQELEQVKKEYLISKLMGRVFVKEIIISEDEIASYYEDNKDLFKIDEDEVRVFHILAKSKSDADLALKEIHAGKSFETVARERSIGLFKEKGGDIGYIRKSDVIPEIARLAFYLPIGKVSKVFKSTYGYHIIKVLKKKVKGSIKELPEVRDDILQRIHVDKERSVYYDQLFRLRNKADVFISVPQREMNEENALNVQDQKEFFEEL
jgi:peptidyl-prolyl cis-trans isomerase C